MANKFTVRVFDAASGQVSVLGMQADDASHVRALLARDGLTALSVVTVRGRRSRSPFDIVLFCDELRTLLSSGMSLVEAIETLCSKDAGDDKRAVLLELQQHLREGKPFSVALELNAFSFPLLLVASIRASERSSRLDDALDEFVAYEKLGRELGKKLVSAAIYPGLVVGFGALVCLFMLTWVVPRFARVYEDFAKGLSLSTTILMKVGQFAGSHLELICTALATTVVGAVMLWRSGRAKKAALRVIAAIPLGRYYLRLYQLARIHQTMAMLLKGGYTVADAMPLARNLAFDTILGTQMMAARSAILEGKRPSTAFSDNGLGDAVSFRLLQVGERSGDLAKIMEIIGQSQRQEFTLFLERATRVAEPLLLMIVATMVGVIIVLMYMPIFDLAGGI
jgi:general secretion pathway protein F